MRGGPDTNSPEILHTWVSLHRDLNSKVASRVSERVGPTNAEAVAAVALGDHCIILHKLAVSLASRENRKEAGARRYSYVARLCLSPTMPPPGK